MRHWGELDCKMAWVLQLFIVFCLVPGAQAGGGRRGRLHRGYCVSIRHPAGPGPHTSRYRRSSLLKLLSVRGLLSLPTPTHTHRYRPHATLALSSTGLLHCCHCKLLLCLFESMSFYSLSFTQCDTDRISGEIFGCKCVCMCVCDWHEPSQTFLQTFAMCWSFSPCRSAYLIYGEVFVCVSSLQKVYSFLSQNSSCCRELCNV